MQIIIEKPATKQQREMGMHVRDANMIWYKYNIIQIFRYCNSWKFRKGYFMARKLMCIRNMLMYMHFYILRNMHTHMDIYALLLPMTITLVCIFAYTFLECKVLPVSYGNLWWTFHKSSSFLHRPGSWNSKSWLLYPFHFKWNECISL